jgi:2-polyprenyl-6-hydroxyphenyl methylase/3-demethylubiquinone-9 3-methyltransferase
MGYRLWWHTPMLFNPANHAGRRENVFGQTVSINMLCLPEGRTPPEELAPVAGPLDDWRLAGLRKGGTTACKVCGGTALPAGTADINKTCLEREGTPPAPKGVAVAYHRCPTCGFLFTRHFDGWTKERLRREVYGEGYRLADPDAATRRPQSTAETVARLFGAHAGRLAVLECGGGNDRTAGWLKAKGFARVDLADPFFAGGRVEGRYDLVVAFEVVEHLADPDDAFATTLPLIGESGVFMFSTLLSTLADPPGARWWYAAPRNGHVSLHSYESLMRLVRRHGLTLASDGRLVHMAFKRCPDWAARAVGAA